MFLLLSRILNEIKAVSTPLPPLLPLSTLGTFRLEGKEDWKCAFSVLSTRTLKNVGLQTLRACFVRRTRTRIWYSSSSIRPPDLKVPIDRYARVH